MDLGRWLIALAALACSAACHRATPTGSIGVSAPFSDRRDIALLRPSWSLASEDARAAGGGSLRIAIDAENLLHGSLYLRVANPRLVDAKGQVVASGSSSVECRLRPGGNKRFHLNAATMEVDAVEGEIHAEMDSLAIPLAEPGRAIYREWAWLRRPGEIAAIDAELLAYDALPECGSAAALVAAP